MADGELYSGREGGGLEALDWATVDVTLILFGLSWKQLSAKPRPRC